MLKYNLRRPFAYLTIAHQSKKIVDIYLPFFLALIISVCSFFFKDELNTWGVNGVVNSIKAVIQNLPGFYIAALAAIIALGTNEILDDYVDGQPTPTIRIRYGLSQQVISKKLTRRLFLSSLFSYLTAISLLLSVLSSLAIYVIPIIKSFSIHFYIINLLHFIASLVFFFYVFQLVTITLFGLFYLAEKMHIRTS